MDIYEIVKTQTLHGVRLDRLERRFDGQMNLLRRAGLVAVLWIGAMLIAIYSPAASLATAAIVARWLGAVLK